MKTPLAPHRHCRRKSFLAPALAGAIALAGVHGAAALEKPGVIYKIFQFPANQIPRIDGNADDWAIVPDSYVIGTDQLAADRGPEPRRKPDPSSIDVRVRVGWVKGLNRLYFLYEASDNFWDFAAPGLHNDTFELVVDGDRSGGPLIDRFMPDLEPRAATRGRAAAAPPAEVEPPAGGYVSARDAWYHFQGNHAQNYHIFTPAEGKDWCMAWGPQAWWIKRLPWSNIAYHYSFKPGEPGKLIMEFWITPFDYAGGEGPSRAVPSILDENKILGMAWAVLDYDNPTGGNQFWNLSPEHNMFGEASMLCAFQLMPLEAALRKPIEAKWSFQVLDRDRRVVAFQDQSTGNITGWKWDFGDGTTSDEPNPVHAYEQPGQYVVVLTVEGPEGTSRWSTVWDVTLR